MQLSRFQNVLAEYESRVKMCELRMNDVMQKKKSLDGDMEHVQVNRLPCMGLRYALDTDGGTGTHSAARERTSEDRGHPCGGQLCRVRAVHSAPD